MESKSNRDIFIDIPNYSGPLETLLDLAKNQKVDLANISITELDRVLKRTFYETF